MNKKILVIASLIIISFTLLGFILLNRYNVTLVESSNSHVENSGLSIWVDGVPASTIPTGNYMIEEEKSFCTGGGKVSDYDSTLGTVKFSIKGGDSCTVSFIIKFLDINIAIDDSRPTSQDSGYILTGNCDGGSASINNQYQRFEINSLSSEYLDCNYSYSKLTTTTKLKDTVETATSSNTFGYRYTGANPSNWIWFNNEYWRIVGSIPACDTGNGSACSTSSYNWTRYVKIVRSEPIGEYSFQEGLGRVGTSTIGQGAIWAQNTTIYKILNNYYFGKKNATGTDACKSSTTSIACNYEYIGISDDPDDYYGRMIKPIYFSTGSVGLSSTYITNLLNVESSRTCLTTIGVLNASDFGFAKDYSVMSSAATGYAYTYVGGKLDAANWLVGYGKEHIMSNATDSSGSQNIILATGATSTSAGDTSALVRPTVFLKPEVYVISGNGTYSNPYIIGY